MKKNFKIGGILLIVLVAAAVALNYYLDEKAGKCGKGSGKEAIEACSFMIEKYPSGGMKPSFLYSRAKHYVKEENAAAAIADLEAIVAIHENGSSKIEGDFMKFVHNQLASLHGFSGNLEKAVKYGEEAVKLDPGNPSLYINLADYHFKKNLFREALPYLQKAESLGAADSRLYLKYSAAYLGLRDHSMSYTYLKKTEAVMDLETKDKKTPPISPGKLYQSLALTCMELERFGEAEQYLIRIQEAGYECPACPTLLEQAQQMMQLEEVAGKPKPKTGKTRKKRPSY